jgi:UAA transporter family
MCSQDQLPTITFTCMPITYPRAAGMCPGLNCQLAYHSRELYVGFWWHIVTLLIGNSRLIVCEAMFHHSLTMLMQVYAAVAAMLLIAMYCTNVALHEVPYSIKIVVKSCRVLPTMLLSVIVQGVRYKLQQVAAALVLVLGLGLFLAGDSSAGAPGPHHSFASMGVLMLIFTVLLDAITANLEEKYFFRTPWPATRIEVMTFVSSFATLYCILPLVYSGVDFVA